MRAVLKIVFEKSLYLLVLIILMGLTFVKDLSTRVSALEISSIGNTYEHKVMTDKIDQANDGIVKIRCLLGDQFSECHNKARPKK